jgi:hypothetical protein
MRVTLKVINDELPRRGATARLAKAAGYFYFQSGEAAEWLDRGVPVPTVGALTLQQWVDEYDRLKKLNQEIIRGGNAGDWGTVKEAISKQGADRNQSATRAATVGRSQRG